jgi:protein phosphatase
MDVFYSGCTDIGRQRPLNEDSFFCGGLAGPETRFNPAVLLAVADGIGGHAAGAVASALAVDTLKAEVAERLVAGAAPADGEAILQEASLRANREILQKAAAEAGLAGMGTTLVAALVFGETASVSNVGDSRLYLARDGTLDQITRDHSWAAEQLRKAGLSETEAIRSPFRNMVTRSIGCAASVSVDTFRVALRPGDRLLLCSDGLHGCVKDKEILRILHKHESPEAACAALLAAADKAGGRDNITAVVALTR